MRVPVRVLAAVSAAAVAVGCAPLVVAQVLQPYRPLILEPSPHLLQLPGTPPVAQSNAPPKASLQKPDPMKVRLVRSNQPGCEPDCPEWISAEGTIDAATPGEFRKVLTRLGNRKLPILVDSVGGSVDPSFSIARMIRAKGLDVVVTKTVLAPPCAPTDAECRKLKAKGIELGRPEAKISKCASSCAFILAGGVRRFVGAWTVVGLHEIKSIQTLRLVRQYYRMQPGFLAPAKKQIVRQETLWSDKIEKPADDKTYEKIEKFFTEMGISDSVMPILRSAPHTSIRWLRPSDLKTTGLATDFINGEQLLFPPAAVALPGASPGTAVVVVPSAAAGTAPCATAPGAGVPCTTGTIGGYRPAGAGGAVDPDKAGNQAAVPPPPVSYVPGAPAVAVPAVPPAPSQPAAPIAAVAEPAAPATPAPIAAPAVAPTVAPTVAAATVRVAAPALPAMVPAAETPAAEPPKAKPAPKPKPRPAKSDTDTSWRPF